MQQIDFRTLAAGYGFRNVIEYERGSGLLISSGAGVMMAVMDLCPQLRWCLDIDANRDGRLGGLLSWAWRLCPPVVIAGWFSITSPDGLRAAIQEAKDETYGACQPLIYAAPDVILSEDEHYGSLAELAEAVQMVTV